MTRPLVDADADPEAIRSRRIAVIGYGNQGLAQAQNLRDSECDLRIGLRLGSARRALAENDGFVVGTFQEVAEWADLISLLLPDQAHGEVFRESIRPHLSAGKMLVVAHGFSIQYLQIEPPIDVDVALVAPVGPGTMLRRMYRAGGGIPALLAVHQDASGRAESVGLAYAWALGCARVGVLTTSVREETETDLFGEQAVLCGGLTALMKAGFDTLVQASYQPEIAYFECVHQMKLIVDLIYEGGLAGMQDAISDTAAFGDFRSGPRIIDDHVRESMRDVLRDIRSGAFARDWAAESAWGAPDLARHRREEKSDLLEEVGARLRAMTKPT
jgi:ketol-acid reductoisomerase